jgi:uroporphyrin-3 C-methyltransferase
MPAEIESLATEMSTRRPGSGGSPMLVAVAVLALLLALYAHWRFGHFDDRVGRVRAQIMELRNTQARLAGQVSSLTARLETSNTALRAELRGLKELPAQLAVLGRGMEELKARTEAPQRAWARAEALYLLDIAQRQLELDRDVRTAIAAMEAADARLAAFKDPAMTEVRRLLAQELAALRAVPLPDMQDIVAKLASLEDQVPALPVRGLPMSRSARPSSGTEPTGAFRRALRRIGDALAGLVNIRRVDPSSSQLVTREEQSLRREQLEILLLSARVAAMQSDGQAYARTLADADALLTRYFDTATPEVAAALSGIASLRGISVAPPQPTIGAAARQLQLVMNGGTAAQ